MEMPVSLKDFELAAKALDNFTDTEIEEFFLNLLVDSEKDIKDAVGILAVHRPEFLEKLNQRTSVRTRRYNRQERSRARSTAPHSTERRQ